MANKDKASEIMFWGRGSVLRDTWRKFKFRSSQNMKAIWLFIGDRSQSPVEGFQGGTAKEATEAAVIKE